MSVALETPTLERKESRLSRGWREFAESWTAVFALALVVALIGIAVTIHARLDDWKHRQMLAAAARRPADRDALADRLRDGRF